MSIVKTFLKKATPPRIRYRQIGGKLGGLLTEILIGKGLIKCSQENEKVCYFTDKGKKILDETEG